MAVGEQLCLSAFDTDRKEGEYLAQSIRKKVAPSNSPHIKHPQKQGFFGDPVGRECAIRRQYNDFAILYRTNSQSRVIEDELRKLNIPYRIYGGVAFYQRKEIKDAISYFRLTANLQDDEALLRVINFPARGIGNTTLSKVLEVAHAQNIPAFKVVQRPEAYGLAVSTATQNKLMRFAEMIVGFRELMPTTGAYEFARHVLQTTQVLLAAQSDKTAEGQDRLENLQELLNGIQEFERDESMAGNEFVPITDFLAEVSLLTDQDENLKDDEPRVSLMTVHSAKGLEFPVVFIAGMEDKLFPSAFAMSRREMEEERRLFYVAITRAEEECYITYARTRFRNGSVAVSTVSPFINDIDPQYIDRSGEKPAQPMWQSDYSDRTLWRNPPPAPRITHPTTQPTNM